MLIIRGAITAENTEQSISQNSLTLVSEIMAKNNLKAENISGVFFTVTKDLTATYPASSVRKQLKLNNVAFMCMQEMQVDFCLDKCIRIAVFADIDCPQSDARHCYLKGAAILRPDLSI